MSMDQAKPHTWNFFVDGLLGYISITNGVVLVSPESHKLNCKVRFRFKAFNNVAEYKALLIGLKLSKEIQLKKLQLTAIYKG